ncbi:MAG TPA: outer membrane protein assembly factor BamE [Azospirillum sp.]|nr:outer membrane protein assembly factor BamE [Azospirillum sp.]
MTRSTPSKFLAVALLGLAATACAPTVATRGNMTDPDAVATIKTGSTTRDEVASLLGTPTSVGTFDQNVWYYIGQKTEKTAFFKPEVLERRVVVVHFDDAGVVNDVKQLDANQGQEVEMVERTTPTHGRELGFLEQMVGNFGRFSAKDTKSKGPGS